MVLPKPLHARILAAQAEIFSRAWLDAPDEFGEFPTNADRHQAEELWRTENIPKPAWQGFMLQGLAAVLHNVSQERLAELGEKLFGGGEGLVGGKKTVGVGRGMAVPVLVLTGTKDVMIEEKHSVELTQGINAGNKDGNRTRLVKFDGAGHVLMRERLKEYNALMDAYFKEAEAALGRGSN